MATITIDRNKVEAFIHLCQGKAKDAEKALLALDTQVPDQNSFGKIITLACEKSSNLALAKMFENIKLFEPDGPIKKDGGGLIL